jgi:hypothetical protein
MDHGQEMDLRGWTVAINVIPVYEDIDLAQCYKILEITTLISN